MLHDTFERDETGSIDVVDILHAEDEGIAGLAEEFVFEGGGTVEREDALGVEERDIGARLHERRELGRHLANVARLIRE